MKISLKYFFIITVFLSSCQLTKQGSSDGSSKEAVSHKKIGNNKATAVYWQQNSAEYEALCYQAYNSAENYLRQYTGGSDQDGNVIVAKDQKIAIIIDLDETVLNNSPYSGYLVKNNLDYNYDSWLEWVETASAELVPGALEFINNAIRMEVEVFFISNRFEQELEPTIRNMIEKGIQFNEKNVFLRNANSEKMSRRDMITSAFDVVMLIGDNLADLHDVFESDILMEQRKEVVASFKKEFGSKYIILPNPVYGGWEPTEPGQDPKLTQPIKNLNPFINSFK